MDSVGNAENTENQTTAQWQKYRRTPPAPNCAKGGESLLETRLRMKHHSTLYGDGSRCSPWMATQPGTAVCTWPHRRHSMDNIHATPRLTNRGDRDPPRKFPVRGLFGRPGQEHVWTSLCGMGPGKLALGYGAGLGGRVSVQGSGLKAPSALGDAEDCNRTKAEGGLVSIPFILWQRQASIKTAARLTD